MTPVPALSNQQRDLAVEVERGAGKGEELQGDPPGGNSCFDKKSYFDTDK